jgi:hypothetical protein
MTKGIKIGATLAVVSAVAISGNIYKNNFIANEIETNLKKELQTEKQFSFENVSCSGLMNINCNINKPKIEFDKKGGIIADSITINDIAQWKRFKGIDKTNQKQIEKLFLDSIKNGISLSIGIKNLNIYTNDSQNREKIKNGIIAGLPKDSNSNKVAKNIIDKLDKHGVNGSLMVKFTGNEFIIEEIVSTGLAKSSLTGTIKYDGTKINDKKDIEEVAKNAIFKEIKLETEDTSDSTLAGLYLFYKQLAYSYSRSDRKNVEFINKKYSLDTDGKDLSFLDFKKALASDTTSKLIDEGVYQLNKELKNKFADKALYTVIDDFASKIKSLSKGDSKISISINSELSANKVIDEFKNVIFKGATSKPLSKFITLEIE